MQHVLVRSHLLLILLIRFGVRAGRLAGAHRFLFQVLQRAVRRPAKHTCNAACLIVACSPHICWGLPRVVGWLSLAGGAHSACVTKLTRRWVQFTPDIMVLSAREIWKSHLATATFSSACSNRSRSRFLVSTGSNTCTLVRWCLAGAALPADLYVRVSKVHHTWPGGAVTVRHLSEMCTFPPRVSIFRCPDAFSATRRRYETEFDSLREVLSMNETEARLVCQQ